MKNVSYLGLGSNLKSPERQIRTAINSIRQIPRSHIVAISSLYESKFNGYGFQPNYINIVIKLNTYLSPIRLLRICQSIERDFKRIRRNKWGARTLDIDILLYNHQMITTSDLTIPHKEMFNRDFVLKPLLEVAPRLKWQNIDLETMIACCRPCLIT